MSNSIHLSSPPMRSLVVPTLFGELEPTVRGQLLAAAPRRDFADACMIQQRGDRPSGFWVIEQGKVRIGIYGLKGEFRAIAMLGTGDSYGELALFAGNRRAVDAVADGPVTMRWIDARAFEAALLCDPQSMRNMVRVLSVQLQELLGLLASLSNGSAATRIAATLVSLCVGGQADSNAGPVSLALNQQDLAELTGLTRVTVSKCLADLEQQGAVRRGYRKIEICDLAAVQRAAIS